MRFSVIIPVYNVEKYIRRCMDTVMGQTFDDYEVIVVDDESPDNSIAIVQEYVDTYPGKIQVIHQKNTRQGGARNRGVQSAQGEYILFIDSDDYVSLDMLKTVDARLRENPCDILVFRHVAVTESGKLLEEGGFADLKPGIYCPKTDKEILLLPNGPVNKAYRRTFYVDSKVQFPEKVLYEDGVTRLLYAKANSIVLCEDCLYYYVQSSNSSIRQKASEKMLDILTVTDLVCRQFREEGLYEENRDHLEVAFIYGITYIIDIINENDPDNPLQEALADYIGANFPGYRTNPCVSEELRKQIDCLLAHDFRKYHFRVFMLNRFKMWLLRFPAVAKLYEGLKRM